MAAPLALPKKRAADAAADLLRTAILQGDYPAGAVLPPERELSERLGVSRLTLRSAVARLEAEGLVRSQHGSGNHVLDYRETGGVELLGHLAGLAAPGGGLPMAVLGDLLELRRVVAVEVVGLAAERGTDAELAAVREALDRLAEATGEPAAFMRADLAFSRRMVRAAHNLGLELLANTMIRILESRPGIELAFATDPEATAEAYRRLLALVESRRGAAARRTTRRLLTTLDATLLERARLLDAALQGEDR